MSYDLELINPHTNRPYEYDRVTYRLNNSDYSLKDEKCVFAVTYNYGKFYSRLFGDESLCILNGKNGYEAVEILTEAIRLMNSGQVRKELLDIQKSEIKIMRDMDKRNGEPKRDITNYFMPTLVNAKSALITLRHASLDFPNGVWKVE